MANVLRDRIRRATKRRLTNVRALTPMVPPAVVQSGLIFERWPNLLVDRDSIMARFLLGSGDKCLSSDGKKPPAVSVRKHRAWPSSNRRGMVRKRGKG